MCTLHKVRQNFRTRLRPTQVWYRHYFGVQGCHYAYKVAALQFLTVLMQGIAKASLFRTIQDSYGSEVLHGNTAVQCFMVLLLCNIMFAAMILANPNSIVSRVVAALLDAVLDVGYLVTSILMYVGFASEYLEDIFLRSFWNYASIYICAAHVLSVCKSLETADWVTLFQVPRTPTSRAWKRMLFTMVYASALMALVGILLGGVFLGQKIHQHHGLCPPCKCSTVAPESLVLERCFIPTGYVALAAADMLEFNLTNRSIAQVLSDAFLVRSFRELPWTHELHLESNRLTTLPARVFEGLEVKQLHLQSNNLTQLHAESFRGLKFHSDNNSILDISQNKLQALPPKVFEGLKVKHLYLQSNNLTQLHAESFRGLKLEGLRLFDKMWVRVPSSIQEGLKYDDWGILDISQNKLQTLPPRVFAGLRVWQLYLQDNDLTTLPARVFEGLAVKSVKYEKYVQFDGGYSRVQIQTVRGILDMSRNKLQTLPPKVFKSFDLEQLYLRDNDLNTLPARVFEGLSVIQLHLQSNNLTQLHAESFRGLKLDDGILDMSQNKLQTLPPRVFANLFLRKLNLQSNNLTQLHAESFRGLKLDDGILDMSRNKLQTLPPRVFAGLFPGFEQDDGILDMSRNKLQTLPPRVFVGLFLRKLNLQSNSLTQLDADVFSGLEIGYSGYSVRSIIDISRNKLQALPPWVFDFRSSHRLDVLNLAHNEMSELPDFRGLSNLRSLKLEGNRLQGLHQKSFYVRWYDKAMPLEDLNLEQNQLTELHPGCFVYYRQLRENLRELKLGGNRLSALPDGLFNGRKGLSELRTLQLQSNRLARLPQKIFQNLPRLQSLNLSQNKLDELPAGLFDGLNLTIIDLSQNNLTMVDAKLFHLENLTTLDLRGNPLTDTTRQDLARLKVELFVD
eukprot:s5763_g1.t1